MSASTPVTERLTARVMDDMIKVMVDAREFNWGRKKHEKVCDVDTGGWELVHRGDAEVSFPISAFGCKLALSGSEIQIPKVFVGSTPTYTKTGSTRPTRADKLREEQKKKEEEKLKEEERKREEKKAQLRAEIKKKKKEEKRLQREADRRRLAAASVEDGGGSGGEGGVGDFDLVAGTGEVLGGWGDDEESLGMGVVGAIVGREGKEEGGGQPGDGSENQNENKDGGVGGTKGRSSKVCVRVCVFLCWPVLPFARPLCVCVCVCPSRSLPLFSPSSTPPATLSPSRLHFLYHIFTHICTVNVEHEHHY